MTGSNDTTNRQARTDPRENIERAWQVAVNPEEYSKSTRKHLMERGTQHYSSKNEILADASQLIADVLDRTSKKEIMGDPPDHLEQPGRLALIMAVASLTVREHEEIRKDPRNPLIHKKIRQHYLHQLLAAREQSDHSDTIRLELGRIVYGRDQEDDYGPPAGAAIEGIDRFKDVKGTYYKIPLTHANRKCEARMGQSKDGEIRAYIEGPYVYVPEDDVIPKYENDYFTGRYGVAATLENALKNTVGDDAIEAWQESLTGINQRITDLIENGNDDLLLKERRYPAKLEATLSAVEAVDEDIAKLGQTLTAKDIFNAVRDYSTWTEIEWHTHVLDDFNSPSSIATTLSQYAHDPDHENIEIINRDGQPDLYELEYKVGNFKQIEVTEIGDLLELPCMQNLHDSLQQSKPVRWELYSFVRYLFEVNNVEFTVDDIKEWFSQYDWYRADVTEYQVKYEREQVMGDGNRPLPISCSNDNRAWAEHCIGKENCEYSLYQSVELKPDVYDRTGGN